MICIDWISQPQHKNFNRAFFDVVNKKDLELIVFDKILLQPNLKSKYISAGESRIKRYFKICKILIAKETDTYFFITYDPLFLVLVIPIARIYGINFFVFEHNTTPERHGQLKHVVWQIIFMRKIYRLAQFPTQYQRLKELGQNAFYIGSPIPLFSPKVKLDDKRRHDFVVASYRVESSELLKVAPYLNGRRLVVKTSAGIDVSTLVQAGIDIEIVEYIDFKSMLKSLAGIIVTVSSQIRGTGWFNDAISMGAPVLITNQSAKRLFCETFPDYPFVDLTEKPNQSEFERMLLVIKTFHTPEFVEEHNRKFQSRYEDFLSKIQGNLFCD